MLAERSGFKVMKICTYTPNLWVDLQSMLAEYPVREGVRVPFMNGERETENIVRAQKKQNWFQKLVESIVARMPYLRFMRILYLRMIDTLGLGESYLIFLEKKVVNMPHVFTPAHDNKEEIPGTSRPV
jgi:hypothetical protein